MKPPASLSAFCQYLDNNTLAQAQVKETTSASQIIQLAKLNGFEITISELRSWSRELKATYFPWSQMGNQWRRDFFL
tara:strand:+ start:220 stop:450 length:231 start_codon:yes stop_codon:yes gene_type:complete